LLLFILLFVPENVRNISTVDR